MQLLLIKIEALDATPEVALLGKKQAKDYFISTEWSKVKSLARGRRVVLLIPDTQVVLTTLNIPSKNKKQLLQAIPFALEDTLAEDLDDLHFAIQPLIQSEKPETAVAIIQKRLLEAYQNKLQAHGISAHAILPQLLSLKISPNAWHIHQLTDHSVSVRLNTFAGFNCDASLLQLLLAEYENSPPEVVYSNLEQASLPDAIQSSAVQPIQANEVDYKSITDAMPLNLLTGFVSSQHNAMQINWQAWRPSLILGSLLALIWIGIISGQNSALKQQQKALNQAINHVYQSTFPKSRLVNPSQQMSSKLAQLKQKIGTQSESPLPLISEISPLLNRYKDLHLNEVRYQDNQLLLIVESPNLTRLEALKKEAKTKANVQIEIKSSRTTSNSVEATLHLSSLDQEKT